MKIELFGKEIGIKEYHCASTICNDLMKVKEPYVNIYVKMTEVCQARCQFCEFCTSKDETFDMYKLYYVLTEVQKKIKINKISFTGGEPTLYTGKLAQAVNMAKEVCPYSFYVLNTNGYKLKEFVTENPSKFDSISVSRHHYDDEVNAEIYGIPQDRLISSSEVAEINEGNIHFSCNLIKGKIDSMEEVKKYLEWCATVGVNDVGFVSLMKVNDYCKDNHVDFRNLPFGGDNDIIHYQSWTNKGLCSCSNYLYFAEGGKMVKIYSRYAHDYLKGNESNLVYDGQNLKLGFYGDILV